MTDKLKKLKDALVQLLGPTVHIRTSEEFGAGVGGLWMSNERPYDALGGLTIYDTDFNFEVHPKVGAILEKHGFFMEPYDAGTMMVWEA